jgi:transposase
MSFIEGCDRRQPVMFPEVLDDYVGEENAVRFIDAFVGSLDLEALGFLRAIPAETGRPGYDPRDLLALYVYGYLYGIRSSRKLERETHRNVELMWLVGRLRPDFKTIADFRRDNKHALRQACRQFTLLCKRLDLFGAELVAIDGSKFRAVNSRDRSFPRAKLTELIESIDRRIESYLDQLDQQDETERPSDSGEGAKIVERIARLKEKSEECRAMLEEMDRSGQNEISLTDPDSRRMPTGGVTDVCYNVQIAVDDKHDLIVADDVINTPSDRYSLAPMACQAQEVLGGGQLSVVADRGYTNVEQLKKCEEAGILPYVDRPKNSHNYKLGLFTKEDFLYDATKDSYRCPGDQELTFRHEGPDRKNKDRWVRYYATNACPRCPLRSRCTRSNRRKIGRTPDERLVDQMQARVRANRAVLYRRKAIVEHPFGTLKRWMGYGHFLTRGIESVKAEFSLAVLSYNLKRALAVAGAPRMIAAVA